MKYAKSLTMALLSLVVIMATLYPSAGAQTVTCGASVSPASVDPGADTLTFAIHNTSTQDFHYIQIVRPSDDYTVQNIIVGGWGDSTDQNGTIVYGGTLNAGNTLSVQMNIQAAFQNTGSTTWQVYATSDYGGGDLVSCGGSLNTPINDGTPPPGNTGSVSDIVVVNVRDTSVTVTWTSSVPTTSIVYYGLTSSYGRNTPLNNHSDTSHSVNISGLTQSTTYHFQVAGQDGSSNVVASSDNTFRTIATPVIPASGGSSGNTGGSNPSLSIGPIVATDKTPPHISWTTALSASYKVTPTLKGTATDELAVARIEYSIDGGKNWLIADIATGLGTKQASFEFTPANLNDGNYTIVARATDRGANVATTSPQTLVIDRLPPIVGESIMAVGSQYLQPNQNSGVEALSGIDQQITMNAVGGPISITLDAIDLKTNKVVHSFGLAYSAQSGLWTGTLSFKDSGTFQLTAKALDGAGNATSRSLITVGVKAAGKLNGNNLRDAQVSIYYRDQDTNTWILWNAEAYGQNNPYSATGNNYGFYLPAGTYYLRANAPGFKSVFTSSFTIDKATIVAQDFTLHKKPGLRIGSKTLFTLPWFSIKQTPIALDDTTTTTSKSTAISRTIPLFSLQRTDGSTFSTKNLFGKPTILTFVSSWAPAAQDQLPILETINNPDLNIVPVSSGESIDKLTAYSKIAGYNLPILADTDNLLANSLNPTSAPVHYFLDRHGVVKKVMFGVLSKQELLNNVQN